MTSLLPDDYFDGEPHRSPASFLREIAGELSEKAGGALAFRVKSRPHDNPASVIPADTYMGLRQAGFDPEQQGFYHSLTVRVPEIGFSFPLLEVVTPIDGYNALLVGVVAQDGGGESRSVVECENEEELQEGVMKVLMAPTTKLRLQRLKAMSDENAE